MPSPDTEDRSCSLPWHGLGCDLSCSILCVCDRVLLMNLLVEQRSGAFTPHSSFPPIPITDVMCRLLHTCLTFC